MAASALSNAPVMLSRKIHRQGGQIERARGIYCRQDFSSAFFQPAMHIILQAKLQFWIARRGARCRPAARPGLADSSPIAGSSLQCRVPGVEGR